MHLSHARGKTKSLFRRKFVKKVEFEIRLDQRSSNAENSIRTRRRRKQKIQNDESRVVNLHKQKSITSDDVFKLFVLLFFQVWINQSDIILVGLRDYQDTKADVIFKYTPDEARNLKTYGEFPESVRINDTVTFVEGDMDDEIEFDDYSSSDNEVDPVDAI